MALETAVEIISNLIQTQLMNAHKKMLLRNE